MARKINWKEIQTLAKIYVPRVLMNKIRVQAKKRNSRLYEIGVEVVKAGLDALGY